MDNIKLANELISQADFEEAESSGGAGFRTRELMRQAASALRASVFSTVPDAMLPGLLYQDDGVMEVNAELGLSMDQIVKLARAIRPLLTVATAIPEASPVTLGQAVADTSQTWLPDDSELGRLNWMEKNCSKCGQPWGRHLRSQLDMTSRCPPAQRPTLSPAAAWPTPPRKESGS